MYAKSRQEKAEVLDSFVKLPFPNINNLLSVLITNNHIISENLLFKKDEKISIIIEDENEEIFIDLNNRMKQTSKDFDITIIEIKEKDNIKNYLELDDKIIDDIVNSNNKLVKYKDETIYIIQYPLGKLSVSYGILEKIYEDKKYNFFHKCSTAFGSSGSPILNLNNKIIGIHKESKGNSNNNIGVFLNYPIKDFIRQFYHNKPLQMLNQFENSNNSNNNKNINKVFPLKSSIVKYPSEQLNLSEYIIESEIGKGISGIVYKVKWNINQKYYALKKEIYTDDEDINKAIARYKTIRLFSLNTGCQGIVNLYGNLVIKQGNYFEFYKLMEMCDTDLDKIIKTRIKYNSNFTENELMNIIHQLVSTLSTLQKNHLTHRNIIPKNILIVNGKYKIGNFNTLRVMQREGVLVQRIFGDELYMSPILLNGLRQVLETIEHNTYKSDLFSLGMCLFYAACLSQIGIVEIRETIDMNLKFQILNKYLSNKYSQKIIKFLYLMLLTNEDDRPDFVLLEEGMIKYGL